MKKLMLTLLVSTSLFLAGCFSPEQSTDWDPNGEAIDSITVEDFTLTTSENTSWSFSEEAENTTVVIAFLFTNCLDICPIVTHNMKWVQTQLTPEEREATTFLTITVDPWRDNVSKLHEWKTGTNSNWTHLTADSSEDNSPAMNVMNAVWVNFGVGLQIEDTPANTSARHHPDDYTVNHSTGTIIVDRFGEQKVWWGDNDWVLDLFLADLRYLIEL